MIALQFVEAEILATSNYTVISWVVFIHKLQCKKFGYYSHHLIATKIGTGWSTVDNILIRVHNCIMVMVLLNPFREMEVRSNSTETQLSYCWRA